MDQFGLRVWPYLFNSAHNSPHTGWRPTVCTHAYACVLRQLARFGQVITNCVNVWFWNAALNPLNRLNRLTRFRTLLRFYFLRHLRSSPATPLRAPTELARTIADR